MSHSSESHGTHDLNTPSPASGELASLVERLSKGADSASWTEALDLLRLAGSQLAAVAAERDALRIEIEAAKLFGEGFFGPKPSEVIRDAYRAMARPTLSPGGSNGQ